MKHFSQRSTTKGLTHKHRNEAYTHLKMAAGNRYPTQGGSWSTDSPQRACGLRIVRKMPGLKTQATRPRSRFKANSGFKKSGWVSLGMFAKQLVPRPLIGRGVAKANSVASFHWPIVKHPEGGVPKTPSRKNPPLSPYRE